MRPFAAVLNTDPVSERAAGRLPGYERTALCLAPKRLAPVTLLLCLMSVIYFSSEVRPSKSGFHRGCLRRAESDWRRMRIGVR
ncbi:hypothetical protein VZT92_025495 [Zoarces viviparus]|uniref:Uncharacterized protein n=1 Tax=Zoarces viviparus TaxID=48416 RepID=A0AAW1DXA2_ZOAVI